MANVVLVICVLAASTVVLLITISFLSETATPIPTTSSTSRGQPGGNTKPPHIVFVFADDMGYRDIGYMGSDIYTPTLDELAASGVRLDNYYVQPTCSPTRSQFMSGRYQIHMGLQDGTFNACQVGGLPLEYPTIADVLKTAGYSTHALGKWHLGFSHKRYTPLYRGFDTFYGNLVGYADQYVYKVCDATFEEGAVITADNTEIGFCGYALTDQSEPAFSVNGTYSTYAYTDRAIQIIKNSSKSDQPLFMLLSYQAPHAPIQAPSYSYEEYANIINPVRKEYAGMVSLMDEGIAKITQTLKDEGLWENTIFIFSSDNGGSVGYGASNWPLRGQKMGLWEGGIRTLGFITSPLLDETQKGKISKELMHVSDWFPTLAAMAGMSPNERLGLDGVNQWDMIRNGSSSKRTEILHNIDIVYPRQGTPLYNDTFDTTIQAALRVGDYKILTGDPGDGNWYQMPTETGYEPMSIPMGGNPNKNNSNSNQQNVWLFNVAEDPNEVFDVSGAMPNKVREMLDKLAVYNSTVKPQRRKIYDPNCDPDLRGGVWLPWMEELSQLHDLLAS